MMDRTHLTDEVTIYNLAYLIYHSEAVIDPPEVDHDSLIQNDLSELNKDLHGKLSYEDAETIFNLIIDYGEHCNAKYFERGFIAGIKMIKEISNI